MKTVSFEFEIEALVDNLPMEGIDAERLKKMEHLLGQYYILKQRLLAVLEEKP